MDSLIQSRVANMLAQSTNSKIFETKWGHAFSLPAETAFEFASITGSVYSDNPYWPTSPKDFSKIFGEVFGKQFVSGMLDNGRPYATWQVLSKSKPYLFSGIKTVIPVSFSDEVEYFNLLRDLCEQGQKGDYVILRIESRKAGHGLEPLLEYLACAYFRKRGFAVENQIPLQPTVGTPDFAGTFSDPVHQILGRIFNAEGKMGVTIPMLSFRNAFETQSLLVEKSNYDSQDFSIVGEAKVGGATGFTQLQKYSNTGFFKHGYFLSDRKSSPENGFGVIAAPNFNHVVEVVDATTERDSADQNRDYLNWIFLELCVHAFYGLELEEQKDILGSDALHASSVIRYFQTLSQSQLIEVFS